MSNYAIGSPAGDESSDNTPVTRTGLLRQVVVLVVVVFVLPGISAVAGADAQPNSTVSAATTTITGCTTIDSPGTYTLTQDVIDTDNTTCIHVNSSEVVLDGGGHTIDAWEFDSVYGIRVANRTADGTERAENVTAVTARKPTGFSRGRKRVRFI